MQEATSRRRHVAGFTLVEALVALVVLSIGLLGVAALQFTSLKANHGSATRTQAVYLAYDIIDRMRANPTGDYTLPPVAGTVVGDDLIAWQKNIAQALPAGSVAPTGTVAFVPATNMVTVNIKWDDAHAAESTKAPVTGDVVTFSVSTQLTN